MKFTLRQNILSALIIACSMVIATGVVYSSFHIAPAHADDKDSGDKADLACGNTGDTTQENTGSVDGNDASCSGGNCPGGLNPPLCPDGSVQPSHQECTGNDVSERCITVYDSCSTPPTTLTPPTNLTATCNTSTHTATISWALPSGATYSLLRVSDTAYPWTGCSSPLGCWGDSGEPVANSPVTIPGLYGNYTVWAHACDNNGCSPATSQVAFSCAPSSEPDLSAGSVSPTTAVAGTPKTFTATVTNTGGASTGSSFNNLFQIATGIDGAGNGVGVQDVAFNVMPNLAGRNTSMWAAIMSALGGGSSAPASAAYTFSQPGTFYMRVCANKLSAGAFDSIPESNYNNNCGSWSGISVSGASGGTTPTGSLSTTDCVTSAAGGKCFAPASWTTQNSSFNGAPFSQVQVNDNATGSYYTGVATQGVSYFPSANANDSYAFYLPRGSYTYYLWGIQPPSTWVLLDQKQVVVADPALVCTANSSCTSTTNRCGMSNSGTCNAAGTACSASAPLDSACPNLVLTANPSRVRVGESATLNWSATNVTSCTISGQNGFSRNTTAGTDVSSGAIFGQTNFTLNCTYTLSPGNTATVSASAMVRLIPSEIEPAGPSS